MFVAFGRIILTIEEAFGIVLCKFRKERLLSQDELSRLSSLDRGFISRLERGKQQPTLVTIFELASALNISVQKFISEIELVLSLNKIEFNKNDMSLITHEKLLQFFGDNTMSSDPNSTGVNNILLVEDETFLLNFLSGLLESRGYTVITAEDGQAAVDVYKDKMDEIDLILMDIMMPRMDGVTAHKEIKQLNPDAKILLMSGYSTTSLGEIVNPNFIHKPMLPEKLMSKINDVLAE